MAHVEEKLPLLTGDLVWWDGKPHTVDDANKTVAGHPYVAFAKKDDVGVASGFYHRPTHSVPAGESAAVPVREGDAVITLADGQILVLPADAAHAQFDIALDEPSGSHKASKKLPKGVEHKALKDGDK